MQTTWKIHLDVNLPSYWEGHQNNIDKRHHLNIVYVGYPQKQSLKFMIYATND